LVEFGKQTVVIFSDCAKGRSHHRRRSRDHSATLSVPGNVVSARRRVRRGRIRESGGGRQVGSASSAVRHGQDKVFRARLVRGRTRPRARSVRRGPAKVAL